jgi:preprotein translocase subunit SecA
MLDVIKREVTQVLMTVQVRSEAEVEAVEAAPVAENVQYHHANYEDALGQSGDTDATDDEQLPFVRDGKKIGRNDVCPCGSGKKYKQCHGKLS